MRPLGAGFWPGLTAVGCLTALAVWFQAGVIETDMQARAVAALKTGQDWAQVSVRGRDLTLSGLAPDEANQAAALATVRAVYGVRAVRDESALLPVQSPYLLMVEKTADGLTLTGFAPSEAGRMQILRSIAQSLPGVAVDDQMQLARGAPEGIFEMAGYGAAIFPYLTTGSFSIEDGRLTIAGKALNPQDHETALSRLREPVPSVGSLAEVDISPAPLADGPYRWSAEIGADAVSLNGYVPDPEVRAAIVHAAEAAWPDLSVVDGMLLASGVPDGVDWLAGVRQGLSVLSNFSAGRASISGNVLDLSGQASDGEAFRRAQASIADRLSGGLVLGTADIGMAVSP